jgi:hypothetical protein
MLSSLGTRILILVVIQENSSGSFRGVLIPSLSLHPHARNFSYSPWCTHRALKTRQGSTGARLCDWERIQPKRDKMSALDKEKPIIAVKSIRWRLRTFSPGH